jgi:C-terminal processing protease CtpA/Prc
LTCFWLSAIFGNMKNILVTAILIFQTASLCLASINSSKFGGVGIDGAPWADGRIVVKQLVEGGPAQLAGVRVGDLITHIDGKPTEGSNFREMVEYRLRGRAGTTVMIRIIRPGERKPHIFKLLRRQLVIPPKR